VPGVNQLGILLSRPETTRVATATVGGGARIGWLLRGWRVHRLPGSTARSFAPLLTTHGVPADASRVSRWESGQLFVPYVVLDGYERSLDLPRGLLTGIGAGVRRAFPAPASSLRRGLEPLDHLEQALETVVYQDPVGADWLALARLVSQRVDDVALPWTLWRRLTARLVGELGRSIGPGYTTRFEAAALLNTHPRASQGLVRGIGEVVTDPDCPLAVDAISVLQEVPEPQAGDLVVKLVDHPKPQVRRAAVWAATGKAARGHFTEQQLRRLEPVVHRWLGEDLAEAGHAQPSTLDLLRLLPADCVGRLLADHPGLLTGVDDTEDTLDSTAGHLTVAAGPASDPVLRALVEEALLAGTDEDRHHAALTLMASPVRDEVAAECARLVDAARSPHRHGPVARRRLARLVTLLTYLCTERERPLLETLARPGTSRVVRLTALSGLAHLPPCPGTGPDLAGVLREGDDLLAQAALYRSGMTGHADLALVAGDPGLPDRWRRTARWWLDTGPAIRS
jgi:hypothetical protein